MKKIILFPIFLILIAGTSLAYFTDGHTYPTLVGLRSVNSPITQMCSGKEHLVLAGVVGADAPVIHYLEGGKNILSYIGTHTRGGYLSCLEEAGADIDKRCVCVGSALHVVEDNTAHLELDPKYLKKYGCANLICHMIIERSFDNKLNKIVAENSNSLVTMMELDFWEKNAMNPFFEDFKYIELLNDMSGIDMRNDVNIFANGLKGEGFDKTVWGKKLELPWWAIGIPIIIIVLFSGLIYLSFRFGKTWWKWLATLLHLIVIILAVMLLISFFNGKTWLWTDAIISVPANMINIPDEEVNLYMDKVQQQTNYFLSTGNLIFDDSSGLSYVDRNGLQITGELNKAESTFKFVMLPLILAIVVLFNVFLYLKVLGKR